MGKKPDYHVYIDAMSENDDSHRIGYGWARVNGKGKKESLSNPQRLSTDEASITAAKVYAAADALNHIKRNSSVVIHTDNETIFNTLSRSAESLNRKTRAHKKHISRAWSQLEKAVDQHKSVDVAYVEDKSDEPLMGKAEKLAEDGATLSFNKNGMGRKRMQPNLATRRNDVDHDMGDNYSHEFA